MIKLTLEMEPGGFLWVNPREIVIMQVPKTGEGAWLSVRGVNYQVHESCQDIAEQIRTYWYYFGKD